MTKRPPHAGAPATGHRHAPTPGGRPAPPRRRRPLTPTQQDLAARYLPMARAMAKPMKRLWPGAYDEIESAACLALVEAAESFDPGRNVKFATFARHRIWGSLRDVQRRLIALGRTNDVRPAPMIVHLPPDFERHGRVLGIEPDEPVGSDLESSEAVEALFRQLPTRHAAACRQIYLHGKTQHQAARALGCSQSRLSFMHREALDMLNGSWYARVRDDARAREAS